MPKTAEPYPQTPELDKLKAVQSKTQACGEFLEWLTTEKGVVLGHYHQHNEGCHTMGLTPAEFRTEYGKKRSSFLGESYSTIASEKELKSGRFSTPQCGCRKDELMPIHTSASKLLAEFFEIDMNKVEAEKREILEWQRRQNE